jgi:hypothetical protein
MIPFPPSITIYKHYITNTLVFLLKAICFDIFLFVLIMFWHKMIQKYTQICLTNMANCAMWFGGYGLKIV